MRQHIVIVYINAVWPTINEPGRRRSYVKACIASPTKLRAAIGKHGTIAADNY